MSVATLPQQARMNVAFLSSGNLTGLQVLKFKKKDAQGREVLRVEDMPVFRSGTFRDSMGFQHTWEDLHMAQMVSNFELLKSRGLFADVPVRKGHGGLFTDGMDTLIGYHDTLRTEKRTSLVDGQEYTYLLATFEVLDADAQARIESGLWRNRSAEVGFYLSNAEAEFWPVYQGFAYVDIPAVEGLNFSKHPGNGTRFSLVFENEKEAPVVGAQDTSTEGTPAAPAPATPAATPAPAQAAPAPAATGNSPSTATAAPAADATAGEQYRQGAAPTLLLFGKPTTDFAAVQQHITVLEQFQTETVKAGRSAFVKQLATDKKITADQVAGLEEHCQDLTDEQFGKFRKLWDTAPALPLLQQHGSGVTNPEGGSTGSMTPEEQQIELDREILAQHQRAGMSQDRIEQTASFKRLKQKNLI